MTFTAQALATETERYRRELTAYCYRMLGSAVEAEDAAQECLVKAWSRADSFEGRSSMRTWLYKIATTTCIDMQRAPQRRALPMDLAAPASVAGMTGIGSPLERTAWIEPISDVKVAPVGAGPEDTAVLRESVRLAFVAALQHLPPKQRAVLVLREVLDWSAAEVAELLEISVDSVTSALARARSTMRSLDTGAGARPMGDEDRSLLERYVAAFEAYDVATLVSLLREDAEFSMPPFTFWLQGIVDIEAWWRGPGEAACRDSKVVFTRANGGPAAAVYHAAGDGTYLPFALHVFEVQDGRIASICHFLDSSIFPAFDLPAALS